MDDVEELVAAHLWIARVHAQLYRKRHGHRAPPLDDLIQYGALGLLEAARRFDPARGAKFSTFATWRVPHAIEDGVRLERRSRRSDHARAVLLELRHAENVMDPAMGIQRRLELLDEQARLQRAVNELPRRLRTVIRLVLRDSTGAQIAKQLGVHKSRVSQIKVQAIAELRLKLKGER